MTNHGNQDHVNNSIGNVIYTITPTVAPFTNNAGLATAKFLTLTIKSSNTFSEVIVLIKYKIIIFLMENIQLKRICRFTILITYLLGSYTFLLGAVFYYFDKDQWGLTTYLCCAIQFSLASSLDLIYHFYTKK
jgi:hypothetical protein